MRHRIARAGAIAFALAVIAGRAVEAEEPSETLRLTRLGGGEPAAEFSVATPDGSPVGLSGLRGKVVLLNFWATWCEPCLEAPELVHPGEDLELAKFHEAATRARQASAPRARASSRKRRTFRSLTSS